MMRSDPTTATMQDAIAHMTTHGTASQVQDVRKAKVAFALHGIEAVDFDAFPACLIEFDRQIPKLSGKMPALQRLIHAAGISENTYKQSRRAARRLISEFTGATKEKKERKARDDEWTELQTRVEMLVNAGLLHTFFLPGLSSLTDACRTVRLAPTELTSDTVAVLLKLDGAYNRKTLRNGLKALDSLREIPRLTDLLPAEPVSPAPKTAGRLTALPPHLRTLIKASVTHAARTQIEDERYNHLAEPLSSSSCARYRAALALWVETLLQNGVELPEGTNLSDLFTPDRIDAVLGQWSSTRTHTARTHYQYTIDLTAILSRHAFAGQASYLAGLRNIMARLKEGRAAGKTMSAKVRRWCESLLRDPQKVALFDSQHYEYFRLALEALAAAKAEGFDLKILADPDQMAAFSNPKRARAKQLLRRARLFGFLAAYTTIALEAAPYRRQNILGIRHTGPKKTIHLHLTGSTPYAIVNFPNEELKNGKWLTERGETLEPVTIKKRYQDDYGPEILKFYIEEIRPLFPAGDQTHALFPPIERANTTESRFQASTFDVWLAEGSAEIGLPLSSHNFRHGYCTIAINRGSSIEDLAKIMGDKVETLRRHYAWIDSRASVEAVQKDVARRRAESARVRKAHTT